MIVVVEGISASGKSSGCAEHGAGCIIAENGFRQDAPDRLGDPLGAAAFWAQRNFDRWKAALAMESTRSLAVCDTDPLKIIITGACGRSGKRLKANGS